jgi:N-acylglucosamine 2-epimerase
MPGHAIESMWFIMEWALGKNDRATIRRAAEVLRRHLEVGWDTEFGGIFLGIDADGGTPFLPHADKKIWWVHTEALYALLLAHRLTGEPWCLEWYRRVHDWSFSHFPLAQPGEWRQRLDRQGRPVSEVVALPVKDPFHLPRAALSILNLPA